MFGHYSKTKTHKNRNVLEFKVIMLTSAPVSILFIDLVWGNDLKVIVSIVQCVPMAFCPEGELSRLFFGHFKLD